MARYYACITRYTALKLTRTKLRCDSPEGHGVMHLSYPPKPKSYTLIPPAFCQINAGAYTPQARRPTVFLYTPGYGDHYPVASLILANSPITPKDHAEADAAIDGVLSMGKSYTIAILSYLRKAPKGRKAAPRRKDPKA